MQDDEAKEMKMEEVVAEVRKGLPFIRGITVSGGECMLQADFVTALFQAVKRLAQETGHPLSCLIDSNSILGVLIKLRSVDESESSRNTYCSKECNYRKNNDKLNQRKAAALSATSSKT